VSWLSDLWNKIMHRTAEMPAAQDNGGKPMKRALLVGINAYPGCPLQGCVNDVNNMRNLLVSKYGFGFSTDICVLTDGQATTSNILAKLKWLVAGAKPGDTILFHYSGHGAQTPTSDPSSPTPGLYDCICPVDFDWSTQHMITDKQFVQIFGQLPSGVIFNWLSDSCHSGDLDRNFGLLGRSQTFFGKLWNRIFPKKHQDAPKAMPIPPAIHAAIARIKKAGTASRGIVNGQLEVGFISGCKSDQTSADAYINGQHCGALTTYFLTCLKAAAANTSLSQLTQTIVQKLDADGYEQEPQCSGTRQNSPFLG